MREHPRAGAEIVRAIDELAHLAPAILAHHERIDGTGYPHGIAGDHIPFAARGVAIVDAFHAMTSHRSYRAPLAPRAALAELARARATQFDATLVDVFTEVFTESALSERRSA
jgi:HD-GYP domain-containing protein (c-di-GMP phosphodiesterase class II)